MLYKLQEWHFTNFWFKPFYRGSFHNEYKISFIVETYRRKEGEKKKKHCQGEKGSCFTAVNKTLQKLKHCQT